MDILKQELAKKRQTLTEQTGRRKFFKRSQIEQKRIQNLKEEQKQEQETKQMNQTLQNSSKPNSTTYHIDNNNVSHEQKIDSLNLPKLEVIRKLRFLKQPVTLFSETDDDRLDRLKSVLKSGLFELDEGSDMTEGHTNDFLRDIIELKKRQKSGVVSGRQKRKKVDHLEEDGDVMKREFGALCDEDKILVFFKKLLVEWNEELDKTSEVEKRTAIWKGTFATFKQCQRDLNPLFKFCRKKVLPDDIKQALMLMVNCCLERDYKTAEYHYIRMAIGNAPWPIGETMVGIHERSAREKVYTSSVAHVMNDEITRKYLQSVKRLMTFCERRYPTMPSKTVELNSLAKGSDLQALLDEEKKITSESHFILGC